MDKIYIRSEDVKYIKKDVECLRLVIYFNSNTFPLLISYKTISKLEVAYFISVKQFTDGFCEYIIL